MRTHPLLWTIGFCLLGLAPAGGVAAEAPEGRFQDAMQKARLDYVERLSRASEELNRTRQRIGGEKAPFLQEMRTAEDRIIAAETEITRLETGEREADNERRRLLKEFDGLRKTVAYLATLGHDGLQAVQSGLAPGEAQFVADTLAGLERKLAENATGPNGAAALEVATLLRERTQRALGGSLRPGSALVAETNLVVPGTLAFAGPETYFVAGDGSAAGVVRSREGSPLPVVHALPEWAAADAAALVAGRPAVIFADASNGKALRLRQTSGTVLEHIAKGGLVAYLIVVVGVVALAMIIGKFRDLARMKVASRAQVQAFLAELPAGSPAALDAALASLTATTRELFAEGLAHRHEPKVILEERLHAVLLGQRLHFERRLPLLAVIATAAPLMGLLGTVVGMVKTFALITVFGTGNAGKLSSGISEVLVATELGLAVAIPSLVVHGFLAHRIHKNLAVQERHALELVTAIELARARRPAAEAREQVSV